VVRLISGNVCDLLPFAILLTYASSIPAYGAGGSGPGGHLVQGVEGKRRNKLAKRVNGAAGGQPITWRIVWRNFGAVWLRAGRAPGNRVAGGGHCRFRVPDHICTEATRNNAASGEIYPLTCHMSATRIIQPSGVAGCPSAVRKGLPQPARRIWK